MAVEVLEIRAMRVQNEGPDNSENVRFTRSEQRDILALFVRIEQSGGRISRQISPLPRAYSFVLPEKRRFVGDQITPVDRLARKKRVLIRARALSNENLVETPTGARQYERRDPRVDPGGSTLDPIRGAPVSHQKLRGGRLGLGQRTAREGYNYQQMKDSHQWQI